MTQSMKKITAGILILISSFGWSAVSQADEILVFGTYAFEKPTTTVTKLRPILDVLETKLTARLKRPIKIRLRISKDYRSSIKDLTSGKVDFGRFGQAAYIVAKSANRDLKVITVEGDHKLKTFRSIIVAHRDSSIQDITGLADQSFAFGDEYSTTGRYLPQAFLAQNGITSAMLSKFAYLGRHDRVAAAVADGQYDAGAISEWVFKDLIRKGAPLKEVASFSSVTKPWVAHPRMSTEMVIAVRKSLIEMRGVKVLDLIKKDCFLPGHDDDYDKARLAISDNWAFFQETDEIPLGLASGPMGK